MPDHLRVDNDRIIDGKGREVQLRGCCLGGWMNMENFINGFPGYESELRKTINDTLGEQKGAFFFEKFMEYFVNEEDVRFLKEMGCNVVRVPFNYRHFEDDMNPFEYKQEGFEALNRLFLWCNEHKVYVILDLHAAQGGQNPDWHCDNPGMISRLWDEKHYRERTAGLWNKLAAQYADEPYLAGYNLLNEPVSTNAVKLNSLYRELIAAIRQEDKDHIIFLDGNYFATEFQELEPPVEENIVYSPHHYIKPGFSDETYPGTIDGELYDAERLEQEYLQKIEFINRHNKPVWVGEFGSIYAGKRVDESRINAVHDMISIFEKHKHHWTIWPYKDIGLMGMVHVSPKSAWMKQTKRVRKLKKKLGCDLWGNTGGKTGKRVRKIGKKFLKAVNSNSIDRHRLYRDLQRAVRTEVLSRYLLPSFAEQFQDMDENQIDTMLQSFSLKKCIKRKPLIETIKTFARAE